MVARGKCVQCPPSRLRRPRRPHLVCTAVRWRHVDRSTQRQSSRPRQRAGPHTLSSSLDAFVSLRIWSSGLVSTLQVEGRHCTAPLRLRSMHADASSMINFAAHSGCSRRHRVGRHRFAATAHLSLPYAVGATHRSNVSYPQQPARATVSGRLRVATTSNEEGARGFSCRPRPRCPRCCAAFHTSTFTERAWFVT